ncbi:MAG TPA: right-handed parallel beta-helix repeat-containing protein [Drouetiella sp.]
MAAKPPFGSSQLRSISPNILALTLILATNFSLPAAHAANLYDVRKYGATGNGVTDDSRAIAQAINLANQRPGSIVYFPAGTYFIGSANPVLKPVSVIMEGVNNFSSITFGSTSYIDLEGTSPAIRNLKLVKNGSTSIVAVQVNNASDYDFSNDVFTGDWFQDVYVTKSGNGSFSQNQFLTDKLAVQVADQNNNLTFTNNTFTGTQRTAYFITPQNAGGGSVTIVGNTFTNGLLAINSNGDLSGTEVINGNTFKNVSYGVSAASWKNFTFTGNNLSDVDYGVFESVSQDTMISGNNIQKPAKAGLHVSSALNSATLTNNKIENISNPDPGLTYGIYCSGCAKTALIQDNVISGSSNRPPEYMVYGLNNNDLTVKGNQLSNGNYGIYTPFNVNNHVAGNKIRQMNAPGIVDEKSTVTMIFNNNDLRNCFKKPNAKYDAMIYVNYQPGVAKPDFRITNNTYTGSPGDAELFIHTQGNPVQFGNKTNTMLPSQPPQP